MGYKILDVKADIHEDVEAYFNQHEVNVTYLDAGQLARAVWKQTLQEDILDIVDKHFEKIER